MVDPFSNIEESFKNAFEHWDAPHSASEMNAGWDQVSHHLPQVPHTPSAGHAAGHIAGGAGKIIAITAGIGAAVITTVAVLYNIYVKPVQTNQNNNGKSPAITEQSEPGSNPSGNPKENSSTVKSNKVTTTDKAGKYNGGVSQTPSLQNNSITSPINPFGPALSNKGIENFAQQKSTTSNNIINPVQPKTQSSVSQVQAMKLFLSDTIVCTGVKVTASSNMSYPGVTLEWGDGNWNDFTGQNVHSYIHSGTFRAHLTIDSFTVDRMITVLTTPKARFTVTQSEKMNYSFNNSSSNASSYSWNYGDNDGYEPGYYANHAYGDTGHYEVQLVAINSTGCTDTAVQYINVRQFSEPDVTSNFITPNGDGNNDDVGVTIEGETSFQFTIMDATGHKVFQTSDKNKLWGGQNQFTGEECKQGDYYYTITYSFNQNSPPKPKTGTIRLIRSKN